MISIVNRGGLALVQDPEEALFDGMPASVLRNIHVDHVLSAAKMGALLRDKVTSLPTWHAARPPSPLQASPRTPTR